jgi:Uma2 family endonuclease
MPAALKLPPPAPPSATEADLLALPEEGRGFELIDGALVEKVGGFRHGRAQVRLGQRLEPYDRGATAQGGGDAPGGWWFIAEQLVRFAPGDTYRPDVAGWRRERLPEPPQDEDAVIEAWPDWICEIISPTHAADDLVKKKRVYHRHAVPHYWIVDPRDQTLTALRWGAEGYVEVLSALRSERVRAEPFAAVEFLVGVLFGDDEPSAEKSPGG